jgi:ribosome-binding factor A
MGSRKERRRKETAPPMDSCVRRQFKEQDQNPDSDLDRDLDREQFEPYHFEDGRRRGRPDRKTAQLCAQVRRALSSALAELADPSLRDLLVGSVEPAPDAGRLAVRVFPSTSAPDLDTDELRRRLRALRGFLRAEVAAAIHRKRTPELDFLVTPGEVEP